jgi:predicted nucleic acid-binding protein
LSFDLDRALRQLKPGSRTKPLERTPDADLVWVDDLPPIGGSVLLDTSVYIDIVHGRSPDALERFISLRTCNHSAVCLSELTHAFGRLNPGHPGTRTALAVIEAVVDAIPPRRAFAPETDVWGAAGILAGLLFRLGGFPKGAERKCLNDALIYLQARKLGCAVLTANARDFDYLNQLVPDGRVILYRRAP